MRSGCPRTPSRATPPGSTDETAGPADGVVYFANAHTIGIRTQDALYRFLRGFGKPALAAHHLFADDADPAQAERAWEGWLRRTLG